MQESKLQVLEARATRHVPRLLTEIEGLYQRRTFRAVENWIVANAGTIDGFERTSWNRQGPKGRLVKAHLSDLRWGEQSCSHSAPLGQRTNHMRQPDKPTTYPGWRGQITLLFETEHRGFTDALKAVGVCTIGGSGGSYKTARYPKGYISVYEVMLWGEDFPNLVPPSNTIVDNTSWGARTELSLLHDIFHFDRMSFEKRAHVDKWAPFVSNLEYLHRMERTTKTVTPYCHLWDSSHKERAINYAARAFSKEMPYYVDGSAHHTVMSRLKHGLGNARFLGRFDNFPALVDDIDELVLLKLKGDVAWGTQFIDLRERAEAIGAFKKP